MQSDLEFGGTDKGDDGLFVQFHLYPVQNEAKSRDEGRPIFDDVEFVRIRVPGDRDEMDVPATEQHRRRFARQYAAFKAGTAEAQSGTPLEQWPGISRSQCEELKHFRIFTVEQLASMSDGNLQNVGPVLALRQRARDFMAQAKGAAPVEKLRAELSAKDNEIEVLKKQMADLIAATQRQGQQHDQNKGKNRQQ